VFATSGPPVGSSVGREIEIEGTPGTNGGRFRVESTWASPGYFETLEIPLLAGRPFQDGDQPGRPPVAIVNETMARRVFGSPNAVGRRFRYGGIEQSQEAKTPVEIVGVVRDTSSLEFAAGPQALFYLPAAQGGVETSTLGARTLLDATALLQAMQHEVQSFDAALPILQARTMEQNLERRLRLWKGGIAVLGGLGGLALALASVGLYAVVRFAVSKRMVELGIRMALGARTKQVVWLVMQDVMILIGVSIAIGSLVSLAGTTLIKSFAETPAGIPADIPGTDLTTLLSVVVLMAATAGAAAYFPARRAAKADPAVSLRHQ
jgi:ABC-type antimicrobial peptide transport system permease subunit